MKTTLIIFSGLPGIGKSTLAQAAVQELQIPLLGIDDIVSFIPAHMRRHANPYWDDMISILLNVVESQLKLGLSVMVDSVFMGEDRYQAYEMAHQNKVDFRPIYTYVSDEKIWKERVRRRVEASPPEIKDEVATWERLQEQRKDFYSWKPGSALFVNGVDSVESNIKKVLEFITSAHVELEPL